MRDERQRQALAVEGECRQILGEPIAAFQPPRQDDAAVGVDGNGLELQAGIVDLVLDDERGSPDRCQFGGGVAAGKILPLSAGLDGVEDERRVTPQLLNLDDEGGLAGGFVYLQDIEDPDSQMNVERTLDALRHAVVFIGRERC